MMPVHRLLPCLCLAALAGCFENDDDLLSTADEKALGTDPALPDTDGDGLLDGMEVHVHHTDPTVADTDGDGDPDGWEIEVGLDPLDPASRRYVGGWPHLDVATKEELQRSTVPSVVEVGARVRNFHLLDSTGQRVELYDFARGGTPTLALFLGTAALGDLIPWLASWPDEGRVFFTEVPDALRDLVRNDDLRMILVVSEGVGDAGESSPETIVPFAELWPDNTQVPLLADDGFAFWGHLGRPFLEAEHRRDAFGFVVLDEDMIVRGIDDWDLAVSLAQP